MTPNLESSSYLVFALRCLRKQTASRSRLLLTLFVLTFVLLNSSCFEEERGERYYGRVVTPRTQELRWSDGGLPQIFDPALAAVPPDTDVVRAIFEGLTDYDSQTLKPLPAVAVRWESTPDKRQWTFYLRKDARWSNGELVTSHDFVRSWERTLHLGERAPHVNLFANIEGAQSILDAQKASQIRSDQSDENAEPDGPTEAENPKTQKIGVEALNDFALRVHLERPDKEFPSLVAHPVFRPVHQLNLAASSPPSLPVEQAEETQATQRPVISNGAFLLSKQEKESVVLERADSYWDADKVALKRVRFVPTRDTEHALAAYKAGELDVVTNAAFEPLALKLLAPYEDFRRATYAALTYYLFNTKKAPFDDKRVRRALAIAIDRERICADTMGGMTQAAQRFMPEARSGEMEADGPTAKMEDGEQPANELEFNPEEARRLFEEAGFPNGIGFPRVRLLINRNEQHRAVAQAVAGMWRNVLGVETEIIALGWDEYESTIQSGDYDIARRSVVMQTTDEETNMLAMFGPASVEQVEQLNAEEIENFESTSALATSETMRSDERQADERSSSSASVLSEAQALSELPAIPIYFASSYALIKPYVSGFATNLLDAPSLKNVRIDTSWHDSQSTKEVRAVASE